jgi:DNA topoisomerase IB
LGSQAKPANDGRANVGRPRNDATQRSLTSAQDPAAEAAQEAGLVYTTDVEPGLRRVRKGKGFIYLEPDGKPGPRPRDAESHPIAHHPSRVGSRVDHKPSARSLRADEAAVVALLKQSMGRKARA